MYTYYMYSYVFYTVYNTLCTSLYTVTCYMAQVSTLQLCGGYSSGSSGVRDPSHGDSEPIQGGPIQTKKAQ